jgi:2-C-methyl-D-erythritol 4-phosphate cytidylyltransferase
MKAQALIPTAGRGERMKASSPKPLLPLAGRPVIIWTLSAFEHCPGIASIILVVPPGQRNDYEAVIRRYRIRKPVKLVDGGDTRTCSVRNGLAALDRDTRVVMVHDGVRPLVSKEVLAEALGWMKTVKAAVAAVPVKPTLKLVDPVTSLVRRTLDRDLVWEVQTPQVFRRDVLEAAYAKDRRGASDDAALVERSGVRIKVFRGDYRNIKITTPEDMVIARAFLKGQK